MNFLLAFNTAPAPTRGKEGKGVSIISTRYLVLQKVLATVTAALVRVVSYSYYMRQLLTIHKAGLTAVLAQL